MTTIDTPKNAASTTSKDAPNRTITTGGGTFAYRELGPRGGVPLVLLHHLTATMDDWDPRVLDGIAARRHVIVFDNRGVGASSGSVPRTIDEMAADAVEFIRALGYDQVDLLGFSLGGGVAQVVTLAHPELVRKAIFAGTGTAGAGDLDEVTKVAVLAYVKAALTLRNPKHFLFFPRTAEGKRAATDYMARLEERTEGRDKRISLTAIRNQLTAIRAAAVQTPYDLGSIQQPVLVANGDNDVMVDSAHSVDMARRLPNAELVIYPNSGHGGIFQYHEQFVPKVLEFLAR
ncbi:alpha/beta hydrolase [Antrihabitans sp. YC3-6]|uniref:Alpha/beta hydrolase n=1 Tax=Antrihabitans stalagmiti TaxID=2799499 RepID=A0A934NTX5_9NOCA|nr:alpha/beta hydrolase [Antrihabitans stalagmiti]MBJ8341230.1 alpha/beta hydrolase [Antrihabitans stalagmiti]